MHSPKLFSPKALWAWLVVALFGMLLAALPVQAQSLAKQREARLQEALKQFQNSDQQAVIEQLKVWMDEFKARGGKGFTEAEAKAAMQRFRDAFGQKLRNLPHAQSQAGGESRKPLGKTMATASTVASIYTVTNTDDAGAGSLRQAILDANANAGADDIVFDSGVTGTITLTSGFLEISDDLTITGPGANVLTVDGNAASNVFNVPANNVTISGLTIANGNAFVGGGISYFGDGTMNVTNCTLTNNVAFLGGGIQSESGTVNVTDCTLSDNFAFGASGPAGGGIFCAFSAMNITNCTISGNSTQAGAGGGIASLFGQMQVTNSTISGNFSEFFPAAALPPMGEA